VAIDRWIELVTDDDSVNSVADREPGYNVTLTGQYMPTLERMHHRWLTGVVPPTNLAELKIFGAFDHIIIMQCDTIFLTLAKLPEEFQDQVETMLAYDDVRTYPECLPFNDRVPICNTRAERTIATVFPTPKNSTTYSSHSGLTSDRYDRGTVFRFTERHPRMSHTEMMGALVAEVSRYIKTL
jgi:hypothetical protein